VRVGVVSPYPLGEVSGISALLLDLATALRDTHAFTFLGPAGPPVTAAMDVVAIPVAPRLATPRFARATAAAVRQRAPQLDLVHVHQAHPQAEAAGRSAKAAGLPVVATIHVRAPASPNRLRRLADARARRWILRKADRVVFVSAHTRREFGDPSGLVIPNAVGPAVVAAAEAADREASRRRLGIGKAFTFLFCGRQTETKGYADLLRAAVRVRAPFRLLAVGSQPEPERPGLAPLEAALGEKLRNLGPVERGRWDHYAAADAFLLPSHFEGMPMSLLEAMAFRLPAIVTPVGGIPEAVGPAESVPVPARDPSALASAMTLLLEDPAKARSLGRAARARLDREFTMAVCSKRYAAVYDEVTAAAGRARRVPRRTS
jgi:glycosyltransferase involved in cell wall biosynthesis